MISISNLSFCIYIGNTTSIDEKTLFNYCSRFGTIRSILFEKEKFCDFHLIEFSNYEQTQRFLNQNNHEIDRILLDIKSYKHLLTHHDILNIDRKFYIGPILNSKDEHTIVQFYKAIDPTLQYCLSEQDNQIYLLIEFNNRQSITRIFENQTMPIANEYRKFSLYKPIHPKEFVNKLISMKNKQNQINIHGLTDQITETMLIDYFHKRAPVIACHILSDNSKSAIVEFNDKKTVRKMLETPNIRLQGTNLSLSQASRHLASLLSSTDNNDDTDDDEDYIEIKTSPSEHIPSVVPVRNQPPPIELSSTDQETLSFVKPISSPIATEPIFIPSPKNNDAGWSSPPRTVISQSPIIDQPATRITSNSDAKPNSISTDPTYRLTTIDPDVKPIPKSPSNSILRFFEQVQTELDQIKDEYKSKFDQDQAYIDREINLLINEERQTFDKLDRYLIDHRRRAEKRNNTNKRKHSSSPQLNN